MVVGIMCALGAGLVWGLVFIVPLLLADYPGPLLALGRYAAFGLIALVPALWDRPALRALSRADWTVAFKLSLAGNLLYYAALASAIQLADAPLPTMIIGTLPVIISIYANWQAGPGARQLPWRHLALPLLVILCGLLMVNASEMAGLQARHRAANYWAGCALTVVALAAWTWYPVNNARHLRAHPHIRPATWATAQGLAILPISLGGFALCAALSGARAGHAALWPGPTPLLFICTMLVTGLAASWLGTLLWNQASQRLPTSLAGQLIVFETLAALMYAFCWRGTAMPPVVLGGAACLCVGVLLGVRAFRVPALAAPAATVPENL